MTSPISNDKSLGIVRDPSPRAQSRENTQVRRENNDSDMQTQSVSRDNEPDVARASSLYSQDNVARAANNIETASQARSVLSDLKAQMSANPAVALGIFGNANPQQAAAVLAQAGA